MVRLWRGESLCSVPIYFFNICRKWLTEQYSLHIFYFTFLSDQLGAELCTIWCWYYKGFLSLFMSELIAVIWTDFVNTQKWISCPYLHGQQLHMRSSQKRVYLIWCLLWSSNWATYVCKFSHYLSSAYTCFSSIREGTVLTIKPKYDRSKLIQMPKGSYLLYFISINLFVPLYVLQQGDSVWNGANWNHWGHDNTILKGIKTEQQVLVRVLLLCYYIDFNYLVYHDFKLSFLSLSLINY